MPIDIGEVEIIEMQTGGFGARARFACADGVVRYAAARGDTRELAEAHLRKSVALCERIGWPPEPSPGRLAYQDI